METNWDKALAVFYALLVHAVAIGLLFIGLLWEQLPLPADDEGPAIEATLVSSPLQSVAAAKTAKVSQPKPAPQEATPPPQPKPEPNPQDAPQPQQLVRQAPLPKPDKVNQDEVRRAAELAAEQKQLQEQEERRKQAQIDLTKQQKQQEEAENRQRLAQQQLEQQRQLDAIRKQRAAAERDIKLKEQAMKQLQDQAARIAQEQPAPAAVASPVQPRHPAGSTGTSADLTGKYLQAIRAVANENWRHDNVPEKVHCHVRAKQLTNGDVVKVTFLNCPLDAAGQASVEAALERSPLPTEGFDAVWQSEVNIDMCYPEEACK
ncbi:MAG TPA: cell envelope integrity protein TolA [Xanthomonadaceae bacterium]|jgi:colicin import membrane protein|nr:cell envelope integrity protein TolA [Xanthomonadaceae bacterium]